jgi:BirA family biotin operon repressor/biotin-[acetyl-CoA-carboxylase] ligase
LNAVLLVTDFHQRTEVIRSTDIVCDHGKLAGILVDVLTGPDHRCTVIVGIGVNLKNPAVITNPLDRLVANLVDLCAVPVDRTRLIALIIADLSRTLETFDCNGFSGDVDAWNACDAYAGFFRLTPIPTITVQRWSGPVRTSTRIPASFP